MDLTDEQWNLIQPLLPERKPKREDRPGRPPTDASPLWNGIQGGKGTKVVAAVDGAGLPVAVGIASASPHEVKVLEAALDDSLLDELPERRIGDKAYDSDKLDERLWDERGVKLIAPHRRGCKREATQDGRELRWYKRRWKVERFFA